MAEKTKIRCKTCENHFVGNYCNECGEKVVHAKDFSIRSIIGQAVGSITNLDSKLFRTLKLLFFKPGILSLKFVEGIRVPYMKPFQIFILSNIIFFVLLSETDLFRTPSKWFFTENFDGIKVMEKVREIATTHHLTEHEIALIYDNKSSDFAKGFIVLLIPFIAMISMFLNWREKIPYGKHIIFATHYFSFVLVFSVLWVEFGELAIQTINRWFYIIPVTLSMTIYYIIGIRNFYQQNWWKAILKGIVGVLLINICIQFYRVAINLLALNTI